MNNINIKKYFKIFFVAFFFFVSNSQMVLGSSSDGIKIPKISLDLKETDDPEDLVPALKILVGLTILSVAPAIVLMMTSFTRIIVVLSFLRQAMGTVNMPPNQVMIGIAMFLTYFTMGHVIDDVVKNAYKPYVDKLITQDQAIEAASIPVKKFMVSQTRENDLALFQSLRTKNAREELKDIPNVTDPDLSILVPAFLVSELKTSFQIGFLIYIPFLIIDMVISSVLMAMGMVMLPPVVISLPFKIVLFVLIDGWSLITENLVLSFNR